MAKYQKTNAAGYVVDNESGAVLNTDTGGYEAYKALRNQAKEKQELQVRILYLEERISRLEKRLDEVITNR